MKEFEENKAFELKDVDLEQVNGGETSLFDGFIIYMNASTNIAII